MATKNDSILTVTKTLYGSKMRCYFKNGNHMREYYDDSNKVIQQEIFKTKENTTYVQYPFYDTVFSEKGNNTSGYQVMKRYYGIDEKIAGHTCNHLSE